MTTLTAPPPPTARAAPRLELPSVAFFGRTLAEYAQFFALDLPALRGRDVLDVGAGPSSFTAEACARRIDAVAVDPRYGNTPESLATHVELDYERMFTQVRARRSLVRVGPPGRFYFPSIAAAEAERRLAAERFLADYATHYAHGRYVGGTLPRLPFFDGTFDLVLCAHLLFTYADRFDYDWHLAACRELVRVSASEVRIHPLCGLDGRPYPKLAALRRELKADGISSEVRAVDYEFFAGSASMLVLGKAVP
jgi:SAM-dependent methyltransferase